MSSPASLSRFDLLGARALVESAYRRWWLFLLAGVGWIVVSAIIFRYDYASVLAIAVLFGVVAISAGAMELSLSVVSRGWWAFLHAFLAVIFTVAGIVAFFQPGGTFVGLAAVISFFFVFAGTWDVVMALWTREETNGWWIRLVAGLIELGLGFWAAGYWRGSATLLVAFVGALTLIRGVTLILFAFRLQELGARKAAV
jgi:uncharacterized membrane protein HdeD (DUF308 family)